MKWVSFFVLFLTIVGAASRPAYAADCPRSAAQPKGALAVNVPPGMRPTVNVAFYTVNVDSSGAVTNTAVFRSSGDVALDIFNRDAMERTTFAPATRNCVAYNSQPHFGIGLGNVPMVPAGPPTPAPEILDCEHAVSVKLADPAAPGDPRRGSGTGRSIEIVHVDAQGSILDVARQRSANDPLLDAETLRVARDSGYSIVVGPSCPSGPRTAIVDLNFYAP